MIAIIDYGVGNLFSLSSSLSFLGIESKVTRREEDLWAADKIILPGVGAFGDAARKLKETGLVDTVIGSVKKGKPLLGICLGMQLLFDEGLEYGRHKGLGLISGQVVSMAEEFKKENIDLKIPHMGWNSLIINEKIPLLKYTEEGDYVYYVHSFFAKGDEKAVAAYSDYGIQIPGVVWKDNVFGCQFHPEKSGETGLNILKAFNEL